jgi:hypothetical protein
MKESETLDKLYLEWSQFTGARTNRELQMFELLKMANSARKLKTKFPDFWAAEFKKIYESM